MQYAGPPIRRIAGFGLTSQDAAALAEFYVAAFGARHILTERLDDAQVEQSLGGRGGALRLVVQLGDQSLDILQFDTAGSPYPDPSSPYSTTFQHFALVVSDMRSGFSRLRDTAGWRAISVGGPQRLPARSGGVVAFKFQDPEGHPLELLEFAGDAMPAYWRERSTRGIFLGIDHSAISVRDTAASIAFYESLGFGLSAQTLNHGLEQSQLDGVPDPHVVVTALAAREPTPHLELLCYRSDSHPPLQALASNAVAATRIRLTLDGQAGIGAAERLITDPDGHHLLLVS